MSAPVVMCDSSHQDAMLINGKVADTRADILGAGAANTQTILTDANLNASGLMAQGCNETAAVIANNERTSYHSQAFVDRGFHALGGRVEAGFLETRGVLNSGFTSSLLAAKDGEIATHKNAGDIKLLVSETSSKSRAETAVSFASLSGLVGQTALQSQLQAANNLKDIQLQACEIAAASRLENDKQFALATLAASKNKEELAAQIAECCCEVKAVVNSTAVATQNLIQATEAARIRDALAVANNENLILRLGGVAAVARG
jgi:hypothetical protein